MQIVGTVLLIKIGTYLHNPIFKNLFDGKNLRIFFSANHYYYKDSFNLPQIMGGSLVSCDNVNRVNFINTTYLTLHNGWVIRYSDTPEHDGAAGRDDVTTRVPTGNQLWLSVMYNFILTLSDYHGWLLSTWAQKIKTGCASSQREGMWISILQEG